MAQFAAGVDVGGHSVKIVVGRVKMRAIEVFPTPRVPQNK